MASEVVYFSGQGVLRASERNAAGLYTGFRDLGNVPALRLSLETDVVEHTEATSGSRLTDFRLSRQNRARVTMTLENFNKDNLAFLLNGTTVTLAGASITNEVFTPTGIVSGQLPLDFYLKNSNLSALTSITDSAGSPASLTEGASADFTKDLASGRITLRSVGSYTQPFKANYTYGAGTIVTAFTSGVKERALIFEGLNTANSNKKVRVEIYRVIFDPVQNFDLINDELAQFEIEGTALYDTTRATDASFGGFARIIGDNVL
jgi:hypothetical protein